MEKNIKEEINEQHLTESLKIMDAVVANSYYPNAVEHWNSVKMAVLNHNLKQILPCPSCMIKSN